MLRVKVRVGNLIFIKYDMTRNDHALSDEIKETIATVIGGRAKMDARRGARREFILIRRGEIWITKTAKYTKMVVGREGAKQELKRCFKRNRGAGKKINSMHNSEKRFNPKIGRKKGLKQECLDGVVYGVNGTFNFAILLRNVRACKSNFHTIAGKNKQKEENDC